MNFNNLKTLINKLESDPDIQFIAQNKNVSELIKIIPFFGSFIEANTLGHIRDRMLNDRLSEIEKSFENIVTIEDGNKILDLIERNAILLYNFIGHFKDELLKQDERLKLEIQKTLLISKNSRIYYKPNNNFHFIIISGASATGKDAILNKVVEHKYDGFEKNELLIKYTTRKKRRTDSLYYKFISKKKYNSLFKEDKIIFPFRKREAKYGFNKIQLAESINNNQLLFCIYTEFESLYSAKKILKELNISTTFILLEAKREELIDRSWGRNFSTEEITTRINSIQRDLNFIDENQKLINDIFDYRIYSGDDKSKNELIREVIMAIENNTVSNKKYTAYRN